MKIGQILRQTATADCRGLEMESSLLSVKEVSTRQNILRTCIPCGHHQTRNVHARNPV